jgi:hypothetical protein
VSSFTRLAQRKTLVNLLVWLCQEHGVPARWITSPKGEGIGFHSMWGYNTSSRPQQNPWTSSQGKTCPGPVRAQDTLSNGYVDLNRLDLEGKIGELPSIIAEVARRIEGDDDDMTPEQADQLNATTLRVAQLQAVLAEGMGAAGALDKRLDGLEAQVGQLLRLLDPNAAATMVSTAVATVNGHTTREADRVIASVPEAQVPPLTVRLEGTAQVT